MQYASLPTIQSPAHSALITDTSSSMNSPFFEGQSRIDAANAAMQDALMNIGERCTRSNGTVRPRARVLIGTFDTDAATLTDGFEGIDTLLERSALPECRATGATTNGHAAINMVCDQLDAMGGLPPEGPAVVTAIITDGEWNRPGVAEAIDRYQQYENDDGSALLAFCYVGDVADSLCADPASFTGLRPELVEDPVLKSLCEWASEIPDTFRARIRDLCPRLQPGSAFVLPGTHPDFLRILFLAADSTVLVAG